jgi:hypothetical protein
VIVCMAGVFMAEIVGLAGESCAIARKSAATAGSRPHDESRPTKKQLGVVG